MLSHFFSHIPGTLYYYSDLKKAEDLRKQSPAEYELASEFMPSLGSAVPKLFLKIKFSRGGHDHRYF